MHETRSSRRERGRGKPRRFRTLTPEELAGDGPKMPSRARRDEEYRPVPSQAEGDRETVEEDLRAREREPEREGREAERPWERERGMRRERRTGR